MVILNGAHVLGIGQHQHHAVRQRLLQLKLQRLAWRNLCKLRTLERRQHRILTDIDRLLSRINRTRRLLRPTLGHLLPRKPLSFVQ